MGPREPTRATSSPTSKARRRRSTSASTAPAEMENRIKEQQLALFADRTSCHKWWSNQFRPILSSLAYTLIATIRRLGLRGTTSGGESGSRRRHTQHPPRPPPSLQRLPVPGPGPSHGSQAQAGITDPFALPTQTHKRRLLLPARAPLAQNRPKQAKTGNGTDNHQPESPASLKSANRKTRDPTSASKNPTLEPFVTNPG